jgi:hypothetical protein
MDETAVKMTLEGSEWFLTFLGSVGLITLCAYLPLFGQPTTAYSGTGTYTRLGTGILSDRDLVKINANAYASPG